MITDTYPLLVGEDEVLRERDLTLHVENGLLMSGPDAVRYLVVHCSATRQDRDYPVEQLLRDHKTRGFRTVGYHFYIRKDGTVTQHRRLLEVGAHCRPYNRCSIGICYEGGLDAKGCPSDTRTPSQRRELLQLLIRLKRLFPAARIYGHCELPGTQPKSCPCFSPASEYGWLETLAWTSAVPLPEKNL